MTLTASDRDVIAAIATPPGRGGIGIVRISGQNLRDFIAGLVAVELAPRNARFTDFLDRDGSVIDQGIALFFPAPHSFTGEDVVELQGHGGPVVMDSLLERVLAMGARLARPGEFSERAFINGKLDLAQAEAIADLIDASSRQAARSALRSLQGEFSERIRQLVEALVHLRIYVEAAIDFPEEEISFLGDGRVAAELRGLLAELAAVNDAARQGHLLQEGMTVVIAGKPNAGKSSLLNALSGRDSAIVTDIPGTTRDLLRERISIDGMPLHVIDTAGLRDSSDPVEQEGIRRAWAEIERADQVLLIMDADGQSGTAPEDSWPEFFRRYPNPGRITLVWNKIDLTDQCPAIGRDRYTSIRLSARTGHGLPLLREHLKKLMGFQDGTDGTFTARRRHLDALYRARQSVEAALLQLQDSGGELVAEDLRAAQLQLGEITGEFTADDLLGRIFASFCIGK